MKGNNDNSLSRTKNALDFEGIYKKREPSSNEEKYMQRAGCDELIEKYEVLRDEYNKLFLENKKLKSRLKQIKDEIRSSMSYRIGSLIVKVTKFPFSLITIAINKFIDYKITKELLIKRTKHINLDITEPEKVTVVIPVYNAIDELKECIESIMINQDYLDRLILINDSSPDPRIKEYLKTLSDIDKIHVYHNETNLGFVKTINKGLKLTKGDVVILNSDTEVTRNWLGKLKRAAYIVEDIGTVTPLSNAAGPFSVPEAGFNELPDGYDINDIAEIVERMSEKEYLQSPTGHGFCMYIRRALIDDIGFFDEANFNKGYCEENDFCMRALKNGWKNIIDDSTYIFHKESASFVSEKEILREANRKVLNDKHPEYQFLINRIKRSSKLKKIRNRVRKELEKRDNMMKRNGNNDSLQKSK